MRIFFAENTLLPWGSTEKNPLGGGSSKNQRP
jgi:hypothetical protein